MTALGTLNTDMNINEDAYFLNLDLDDEIVKANPKLAEMQIHFSKDTVKPSGKNLYKDQKVVGMIKDLKSDYDKVNEKAIEFGK